MHLFAEEEKEKNVFTGITLATFSVLSVGLTGAEGVQPNPETMSEPRFQVLLLLLQLFLNHPLPLLLPPPPPQPVATQSPITTWNTRPLPKRATLGNRGRKTALSAQTATYRKTKVIQSYLRIWGTYDRSGPVRLSRKNGGFIGVA